MPFDESEPQKTPVAEQEDPTQAAEAERNVEQRESESTGEEAQEDQPSRLEQATNEAVQIAARREALQAATQEVDSQMAALRQEMDVPAPPGEQTATDRGLEILAQREAAFAEKYKEDMGIPEDLGDGVPQPESKLDMAIETTELAEMKQEMRKEFVQGYVEQAIEHMLDEFAAPLDESENAEVAEVLIRNTIFEEVWGQAQDFIDTGENIEALGFTGWLQRAGFEQEGAADTVFVTGFRLEFDDGKTAEIGRDAQADDNKEALVPEDVSDDDLEEEPTRAA